jgi:hypothetical protein
MKCKCGHSIKQHTDNDGCCVITSGLFCECPRTHTELKKLASYAVLRAAGNVMAERIQMLKSYQNVCRSDKTILSIEKIFTSDDAAALAAWEQVTR